MTAASRDLTRFCRWLSETCGLGAECRIVETGRPKNGFSAETLLLRIAHDGATRDIVVRIDHPGHAIFRDATIERQVRVMRGLAAQGLPVPAILGWDDDEAVLGAPFLVMRKCDGVALPQQPSYHVAGLLVDLAPAQRARAWREALETMAAINRTAWQGEFDFLLSPAYGAPGLDHYLGWISAWREQCSPAAHPVIDAAIAHLDRHRPSSPGIELLWGDSNAGNFLFGPDGAVTGALDFEAASIGPAEIDLAWWFVLERMLAAGNPLPAGMPDRDGQIAIFERALGRPVRDLAYYEMLAALRMALVIARSADLLIAAGALAADNEVALYNPVVTMLAAMLGIEHDPRMDHYLAMVVRSNEGREP